MEKKPKHILLLGAGGQLGRALARCLREAGYRLTALGRKELDVQDASALEQVLAQHTYTHMINCSAYTQVDRAEAEAELCEAINHHAVAQMARLAVAYDLKLIHISTDYVFDGLSHRPYAEVDIPHPLNVYGASKLRGEGAIVASGCRYLILRTAWLYDRDSTSFVSAILRRLQANAPLKVVADQIGTPTWVEDLAQFITQEALPREDIQGLYHYSSEGVCSWYDFAKAIQEISGVGQASTITPCSTADYPTVAQRPLYSVLDKSLLKQRYGVSLPYWRESLARCLGGSTNQ